jgi:cell wall-associated NlpC family hydrolase
VALHRRPKPVSRTRVSVLTVAAASVVALSAQSAAQAAPKLTLSQATAEVGADRKAADAATQQYDAAQGSEQSIQQKVNFLQEGIAQMQGTINTEFGQLSSVAAAQYRDDEVDPTMQLMLSSDPTQFLNEASAQGELDASQQAALTQLKGQEAVLAREKAEATAELAEQQAQLKQMQTAKSTTLAKLAQAQAIVQQLTPAQQQQVNNNLGGGGTSGGSGGSSFGPPGPSGSYGDAAEEAAYRAAETREGDPYSMGAAGPTYFDCSGLVMWAFQTADGISLPHYSYSDESVGTAVPSLADARVGDILVLEGGDHVGLYAGNGMVLSAPEYGVPVDIQPITNFGELVAIRRI